MTTKLDPIAIDLLARRTIINNSNIQTPSQDLVTENYEPQDIVVDECQDHKPRTIINNINNNNNNNNITTVKGCTPHEENKRKHLACGSLLSPPEVVVPQVEENEGVSEREREGCRPAQVYPWSYLKVDLFNNATTAELMNDKKKLRIKLNFKLPGSTSWMYASAALNSPFRLVKRGFDFSDAKQSAHYDVIEQVYQAFCNSNYTHVRASKCYQSGTGKRSQKGQTIYGMSVVIGENEQEGMYSVVIVHGTNVYDIDLYRDGLTEKQVKAKMIATGEHGTLQITNRLTVDQFFANKPI